MSPRVQFFKQADGRRVAYAVDGDGPVLVCPAWWTSHVEEDWEDAGFRALVAESIDLGIKRLKEQLKDPDKGDTRPDAAAANLNRDTSAFNACVDRASG